MSKIYFGGSRHPQNINPAQIAAVVTAVVASGNAVHVGCQYGADQAVLQNLAPASHHRVFAVHASHQYPFNHHIPQAYRTGYQVVFCAGGTTAPLSARYLLRSIAAFQGCNTAVFFNPGSGSLTVARECIKSGLQIYAFNPTQPARIPSTLGAWYSPVWFYGFQCWQWGTPASQQYKLF